ncbi:Zinc carboxypeptidase A 1 like protein [Verticillium longisporum]|uniref:Zinc carboxypeptidase A 1 like protein n=1 Tax=Verticillium longisporum TaxID=100787 RepID=A0A8I2ZHF1_VERLO|nr:Zinc carboxypeptidase A 1 like protein [Verticillium longisporum]
MKFYSLVALLPIISVDACLTDIERRGGHLIDLNNVHSIARRQETTVPGTVPVGKGDRFMGGKIAPRGLGSAGAIQEIAWNFKEMQSAVKALDKQFSGVDYFEAPFKTYENRAISGISITAKPGKGKKKPFAFLHAGIHPRERGGPDHLVDFASDLLWAFQEKKGIKYGTVGYTASDVKRVVEAGVVIVPTVNPDGLAFDQSTNGCWRKNRNPESSTAGDAMSIGIDLNRNFDIAWNYTQALAPGVEAASTNASAENFYGTGPFSEAETQSIKWVFDNFPSIGWYSDLHSNIGIGLYGWCFDSIQTTDKSKNFRNKSWDGKRGLIANDTFDYREYMDHGDWDKLLEITGRMAWAASDVNAAFYSVYAAPHLYPSSGCSIDHAYARHILDPKKKKILGVGFEFGYSGPDEECPFYPSPEAYRTDKMEVGAAYMEFLVNALRLD